MLRRLFVALTLLLLAVPLVAAEPIKALLITGGGFHDYVNQKKILTEGVSARANVEWTVVLENPKPGVFPKVFEKEGWAEEAQAYNGLILAWPELEKLADPTGLSADQASQPELFEEPA